MGPVTFFHHCRLSRDLYSAAKSIRGRTDADTEINDHRLMPLMAFESATRRVYLTAPLFHVGKTWDRRSRLVSLTRDMKTDTRVPQDIIKCIIRDISWMA